MNQPTTLRHWVITICALAILISFGYMGEDQLNDQLLSESVLAEINDSSSPDAQNRTSDLIATATTEQSAEVSQ